MALGHELGADHQIVFALGHVPDDIAQENAAGEIAGENGNARFGKALCRLFGKALDAGAAGHELAFDAALRAGLGRGFMMAAVVAHELAAEAVLHQRGGAVGAIHAVAAGAADGDGGIAAAVEKEQGLVARRQGGGDVFNEGR